MGLGRDLVLVLVVVSCLVAASGLADDPEARYSSVSPRKRFQMPKLFDFVRFKQIFKKSYSSIAEELVRQKLFLARAFRSFISRIKYRHELSPYYLKVNHMSDWTSEEVKSILIHDHESRAADSTPATTEPTVDAAEIVSGLSEVERHADESGYMEIAEELHQSGGRMRRSIPKQSAPSGEFRPSDLEWADEDELESPVAVSPEEGDRKFSHDDQNSEEVAGEAKISFSGSLERLASKLRGKRAKNEKPVATEIIVDHRESNCFFSPRDQGRCGSCYSFAYTALLEYLHCKATGNLTAFSEQYAVDCGHRESERVEGCDGSTMPDAANFFVHFGMELRATYPYTKRRNQCPYADSVPAAKMGYIRPNFRHYRIANTTTEMEKALSFTPMVIGIATEGTNFAEYGGGVYDLGGCKKDKLDHIVLLVGHGREDGRDYWLIRNSYGLHFGDRGYFKLDKSVGCIFGRAHAFGRRFKYGMFPELNAENDAQIVIDAGRKLQHQIDNSLEMFLQSSAR